MTDFFFWIKTRLTIHGTLFDKEVDAFQHGSDMVLALTRAIDADGYELDTKDLWCITIARTGVRLWPNGLPLERAKALALELMAVPGWESEQALESVRFRDVIEGIARKHLFPANVGANLS